MLGEAQRKILFDAAKAQGAVFRTLEDVKAFDRAIDLAFGDCVPSTHPSPSADSSPLTLKVAMELICHEAIVLEAYRDSKNIWTWGIGVTDASGHSVGRYKDNPQSLAHVLKIYIWLLREKYLPDVLKAFEGYVLSESQLAAALSFHYNTGAIGRASWVTKVKAGDMAGARKSIMEWRRPPEIIERRTKERDLFFEGKWCNDGKARVLGVRKPSYYPDWRSSKRVDISAALQEAMS